MQPISSGDLRKVEHENVATAVVDPREPLPHAAPNTVDVHHESHVQGHHEMLLELREILVVDVLVPTPCGAHVAVVEAVVVGVT